MQERTSQDLATAATRRAAVLDLLMDGQWHSTMEINAVDRGGSEGCRRLRELRALAKAGKIKGWMGIEKRRVGDESTQWEYRAVPSTPCQLTLETLGDRIRSRSKRDEVRP